jgi:hypothetical protein
LNKGGPPPPPLPLPPLPPPLPLPLLAPLALRSGDLFSTEPGECVKLHIDREIIIIIIIYTVVS